MSRAKWTLVALVALGVAFGAGFGLEWLRVRELQGQVATLERSLELSHLHNRLGAAIFEASRGNYELARRSMASLFTALQARIGDIEDISLRGRLQGLLDQRDDTITELSRSEPKSVARLEGMYLQVEAAIDPLTPPPGAASGSAATPALSASSLPPGGSSSADFALPPSEEARP